VRVTEVSGPIIRAEANYLVLQTLIDGPTTIHQSGRYYDTFIREGGRLLLKNRQCIYDTLIVASVLVYPA
jgi:3-phenylpropionate/cinnamic acid dioxygenase small subunit